MPLLNLHSLYLIITSFILLIIPPSYTSSILMNLINASQIFLNIDSK